MLLVKSYLSPSQISEAGTGLFVREYVKAGQRVCDKSSGTYEVYTDEDFENAAPPFRGFLSNFAYHVGNEWRLDKDNEKFINHSRRPNLSPDGKALRDIRPNDELLYDYRQIDDRIEQNPPDWL